MWQPTASIENLRQRAKLLAKIRAFFAARDILEVETPLLCSHTVTDIHIQSIPATYQKSQTRYLQTSPEYCMKRLLAAGSGSIYQISKAFRDGECGHQHNPEFTLLEWYRVGFDHHQLMQEVDALAQALLNTQPADKISYQDLFLQHLAIDPLNCKDSTLTALVAKKKLYSHPETLDRDTCLNLLLTECIEPKLGQEKPLFIYHYPASQAALAKVSGQIAERFELYYHGKELANGFHELNDSKEQQRRFEKDIAQRKTLNQSQTPSIDARFIAALEHLPNCAGVAVGIDRIMMLAIDTHQIRDVMSFGWQHS